MSSDPSKDLHVDTALALDAAAAPGDSDVPAITDCLAQLHVSPPAAFSAAAVVAVLTYRSLLTCIGSFQEDPMTFVTAYKLQQPGPKRRKKDGPAGFLVWLAITQNDLHVLKMMYVARRLDPEVAKMPELSFQSAMDVAASKGRFEILQWLNARSQLHPDDVQCAPDAKVLMGILRADRMDVVQFLLDMRASCIDERLMDVLAEALNHYRDVNDLRDSASDRFNWSLVLLQRLVQQRPSLHATLLEIVSRAGSAAAARYMLSPRSGVDTASLPLLPAIIAAARRGHTDVIELLLAAKREDEAIDVVALRQQLSGLKDARALEILLDLFAQRHPSVKSQLEEERRAASALFGWSEPSTGASSGSKAKRKAAGRAKIGKRQ